MPQHSGIVLKSRVRHLCLLLMLALYCVSCATAGRNSVKRTMEITAYCPCGECCGWERGHPKYLRLNFWSRYVSEGARKGQRYDGRTARGVKPRQVYAGLFSLDSLQHAYKIPHRVVLFPWFLAPHKGSIAADTDHYPFGTEIYVPGYGWGVVEDRGGAIKGPNRLDLYYSTHKRAMAWGRKKVEVEIRTSGR